MSQTT